MASDFQAFSLLPVLEDVQKKIEALEAWEDKVLVGFADGTLMILGPAPQTITTATSNSGEASSADTSKPERWQVLKAHRSFSRKFLNQLLVLRHKNLLLSLCEDGVNAHTLPQLNLTCQAGRTRGASR